MVKKIYLENQTGVDPKFNLWTQEAVNEMLDLFPEFKDKFEVLARGNHKPQGSEIDQAAFDALTLGDGKDLYIKLPSGRYLVPYASTDWYIERTKQLSQNNGFDAEIFVKLHADANDAEKPITLTLVNHVFDHCAGYGVQNLRLGISVNGFDDSQKELFKNVVKH